MLTILWMASTPIVSAAAAPKMTTADEFAHMQIRQSTEQMLFHLHQVGQMRAFGVEVGTKHDECSIVPTD